MSLPVTVTNIVMGNSDAIRQSFRNYGCTKTESKGAKGGREGEGESVEGEGGGQHDGNKSPRD